MKCYLCKKDTKLIWDYDYPDKYQQLIGITEAKRAWYYCSNCMLYVQENDLTDKQLEDIYSNYRSRDMREGTVKEAFDRIINLPNSENKQRVDNLLRDLRNGNGKKLLDIGSGLGVFPYAMKQKGYNVTCIEPNPDSYKFMGQELGLNTFQAFFGKENRYIKYDLVTLIHLLEHIRDPIEILKTVKDHHLLNGGSVYIEVPNAKEFKTLDKDHDEFNSTHLFFFTPESLEQVAREVGLTVYSIRNIRYAERGLERIGILCC